MALYELRTYTLHVGKMAEAGEALLMTQEVKLLHPAPWGPHPGRNLEATTAAASKF